MRIPDKYRKVAGSLGLMAAGALLMLLFYWGRDVYYDHKFVHAMRTNDLQTLRDMGVIRNAKPKPPEGGQ